MAIGDTVQAGLLRADFSPIQKAGQAQAQANLAFGQSIGNVLDKFYEKKREKAQQESIADTLVSTFGVKRDEANHLSKNKEFIPTFFDQQKANKDYQLKLDQFNQAKSVQDLQEENIRQNMANTTADRLQDFEAREDENQFLQSVMSQTASPQAQSQADIAMPGLPALGNGDARNRFMQAQLEDPKNQVPVSSLGSQDFGRFASREGLDPRLSVARMEGLRQAELASQPKPMTPEEELDYKIKQNKELRDQAEEERKETEFTNENKSLPPVDPIYKEAAINAIDTAIEKSKSFFATGVIGQGLQNFASTDARDLVQAISTVEAAVGFDRLQEMRDSSKTGGALGAINTKELQLLSASLGSLDPFQKPETLRANLKSIRERYVKVLKSVQAEKYAFDNNLIFKTPKEAQDFINNYNAPSTQQTTNAIDPADIQSEIDRKKQMIQDREMQNKYFDNPNIQNLGNVNQGN